MSQANIHFSQSVNTENDSQFQIQLKKSSMSDVQIHPLNSLELQELLFPENSSTIKINITNDGYFFHSALEALGDDDLKQPKRLEDAQAKYTFTQFIERGTFKQQPKAWGYRTMFTPVQDDFSTLGNAIQVISSSIVDFRNFRYFWKSILQQLFLFQFISFENGNFLVLLDGYDEDFSRKYKRHLLRILDEAREKNSETFSLSDHVGFMIFKSFTSTIQEILDSQLNDLSSLNWARTTASILLLKLYSIDQLFALMYSKDPSSIENITLNLSKSPQPRYKEISTSFLDPYKTKYQEYAEKDLELTKFFAYNVHPFDEKVGTLSRWFLLFVPLFFYLISFYYNFSIFKESGKTMVQILWILGFPLVRIVAQYFIFKNILWGLSTALNRYVIRSSFLLLILGGAAFGAMALPLKFVNILRFVWVLQDDVYQHFVEFVNSMLDIIQER